MPTRAKILALMLLAAMLLPLAVSASVIDPVDVRGLLFVDSNSNGIMDDGEDHAIDSAKVQLAGQGIVRSTFSYDGIYEFDAVIPGDRYVITAALRDGVSGELLLTGQIVTTIPSSAGYNVPMLPPAGCRNTIPGFAFYDANRDGEMGLGESGVPDATIVFVSIPPGFAVLAVADSHGVYVQELVCGEYDTVAEAPGLIGRRHISVGEVVGGLTNIPMIRLERTLFPLVMSH